MAQASGRVAISVYLTPAQAEDLDKFRAEEGGLSRSAMIRQLAVSQIRYKRWQRVRYRSRKKRSEAGKVAAPALKPAASRGADRYLHATTAPAAPDESRIAQTILEKIRKNPSESVNRIVAAMAARSLGIPFSPELAQRWEPIVRAVREKYAMDETAKLVQEE